MENVKFFGLNLMKGTFVNGTIGTDRDWICTSPQHPQIPNNSKCSTVYWFKPICTYCLGSYRPDVSFEGKAREEFEKSVLTSLEKSSQRCSGTLEAVANDIITKLKGKYGPVTSTNKMSPPTSQLSQSSENSTYSCDDIISIVRNSNSRLAPESGDIQLPASTSKSGKQTSVSSQESATPSITNGPISSTALNTQERHTPLNSGSSLGRFESSSNLSTNLDTHASPSVFKLPEPPAETLPVMIEMNLRMASQQDFMPTTYLDRQIKDGATTFYNSFADAFRLITGYSYCIQQKDEIVEKLTELIKDHSYITEIWFKENRENIKTSLRVGLRQEWNTILDSPSLVNFKWNIEKSCGQRFFDKVKKIIAEQQNHVKSNSSQAPLGYPTYKRISYKKTDVACAHILVRGEEMLSRARKSIHEYLNKMLTKLLKLICKIRSTTENNGGDDNISLSTDDDTENGRDTSSLGSKNDNGGSNDSIDAHEGSLGKTQNTHDEDEDEELDIDDFYDDDDNAVNNDDNSVESGNTLKVADIDSRNAFFSLIGETDATSVQLESIDKGKDNNFSLKLTDQSFEDSLSHSLLKSDFPEIIICITGIYKLLLSIGRAMQLRVASLSKLRALVLLIPAIEDTKTKRNKFIENFKLLFQILSGEAIIHDKSLSFQYNEGKHTSRNKKSKDSITHHIVVLTTYLPKMQKSLPKRAERKMDLAITSCNSVFGEPTESLDTGGTHPTPLETIKKILTVLNSSEIEGKVVWDVGVGHPRMACIFSGISGKEVLGIDLTDVIRGLAEMGKNIKKKKSFKTIDSDPSPQVGRQDMEDVAVDLPSFENEAVQNTPSVHEAAVDEAAEISMHTNAQKAKVSQAERRKIIDTSSEEEEEDNNDGRKNEKKNLNVFQGGRTQNAASLKGKCLQYSGTKEPSSSQWNQNTPASSSSFHGAQLQYSDGKKDSAPAAKNFALTQREATGLIPTPQIFGSQDSMSAPSSQASTTTTNKNLREKLKSYGPEVSSTLVARFAKKRGLPSDEELERPPEKQTKIDQKENIRNNF